jgi:DNA-directed RNA polymerase subunit RPC12/RpoP
MSEFKYACPVCGQHMKCDASQSGTVMECPTCFQKITAPQAPASDEQKFILTGTKVGDRPVPKFPQAPAGSVFAGNNKFPGALVVIIIFIIIGAAIAFVYRGTIFKSKNVSAANATDTAPSSNPPVKVQAPPKPAPVAPPANDANWTLNLASLTNFPDSAPAGRIHGLDFIVERATYQNGALTLRAGTRGTVEFGITVNFNAAQADALAGKSISVATNATPAARVTLRWKDGDQLTTVNFDGGYAMRLQFGELANNRLPGKIYFCAPDDLKSYVMGSFNADIRRPRPPRPKN